MNLDTEVQKQNLPVCQTAVLKATTVEKSLMTMSSVTVISITKYIGVECNNHPPPSKNTGMEDGYDMQRSALPGQVITLHPLLALSEKLVSHLLVSKGPNYSTTSN